MINRIFLSSIAFLLSIVFASQLTNAQEIDTNWTSKKAAKWFRGSHWQQGLKLKAHPSTDKLEFAKQYHRNQQGWGKAFQFIKEHNLQDLAPGRYPIDGEKIYATVTEAPGKDFDKTGWESHRKFIDLQYIIKGKERIGVADASKATITKPYDVSKDLQNYSTEGKFYTATPGTFFLFFPSDAHRPSIKVDSDESIKKLVIKINYVE